MKVLKAVWQNIVKFWQTYVFPPVVKCPQCGRVHNSRRCEHCKKIVFRLDVKIAEQRCSQGHVLHKGGRWKCQDCDKKFPLSGFNIRSTVIIFVGFLVVVFLLNFFHLCSGYFIVNENWSDVIDVNTPRLLALDTLFDRKPSAPMTLLILLLIPEAIIVNWLFGAIKNKKKISGVLMLAFMLYYPSPHFIATLSCGTMKYFKTEESAKSYIKTQMADYVSSQEANPDTAFAYYLLLGDTTKARELVDNREQQAESWSDNFSVFEKRLILADSSGAYQIAKRSLDDIGKHCYVDYFCRIATPEQGGILWEMKTLTDYVAEYDARLQPVVDKTGGFDFWYHE